MTSALPPGWTIWRDEGADHWSIVYRPDIFDGDAHPAPCLPTITVTRGNPDRRPPGERARSQYWHVTFYLEPTVSDAPYGGFDSFEAARKKAHELAAQIANGEYDFGALYQQPRTDYLKTLADLTGD